MIRSGAGSVCCLIVLAVATTADAQLVRIGRFGGGVHVRALFVSVDVLPWGGGTRVRAPFTSVNTGVYGSYRYGYPSAYYSYRGYYVPGSVIYDPVPVYPPATVYPPVTVYQPVPAYPAQGAAAPATRAESFRVTAAELNERLRTSAMRLSESLSRRRDDGDIWMNYLAPNRIVDAIDHNADPGTVRDLVANYDGVSANPQLGSISTASGFAETRALLRQFVSVPVTTVPAARIAPPVDPSTPIDELPPIPPQPDTKTDSSAPAEPPVPQPPRDDRKAGLPAEAPTPL